MRSRLVRAQGDMSMDIQTLAFSIIVGLITGWLAGEIWQGYGYGLIGNLIVGVVGATIANAVVSLDAGIFGVIVLALIGASLLLFIANMIARRGDKQKL